MASGYGGTDGQLVVKAFDPSEQIEPEVMRVSFMMVKTLWKSMAELYNALAQIGSYASPKFAEYQQIKKLIATQQIMLQDMAMDIGGYMGLVISLEDNLLKELNTFMETGDQQLPLVLMQANASSTAETFKEMEKRIKEAEDKVAALKGYGLKMVEGETYQLKDMAARMIESMDTSHAQAKVWEKELTDRMNVLTDLEKEWTDQSLALNATEAKKENSRLKMAMFETISKDEASTLKDLQGRVAQMDKDSESQNRKAVATDNIDKYTSSGWWIFKTTTHVKDNAGDREQARARKLRSYFEQAKNDKDSKEEKAKKATAKLAEEAQISKNLDKDIQTQTSNLNTTMGRVKEAQEALTETKAKIREYEKEHAGLSIEFIVQYKQSIEKIPQLLGKKAISDHTMFEIMQGSLDGNRNLFRKMDSFLKVPTNDSATAAAILKALRPSVVAAIEKANFFKNEMGPLKDKMQENMKALQNAPGGANPEPPPITEGNATSAAEPLLTIVEDDNDRLW